MVRTTAISVLVLVLAAAITPVLSTGLADEKPQALLSLPSTERPGGLAILDAPLSAQPKSENLAAPRKTQGEHLAEAWGAFPITLTAALRLSENTNLDIGQSREVLFAARAGLMRAGAWFLPNFNIGSTYSQHEGNIAKTEGNIIKVNKTALFVGGGPSMNFAFTDAIYGPLIARDISTAAQAGARRVTNDTLQNVANAYLNVLRARRRLARVDETIDFLTSDQPSAARAQSRGLVHVVESFYKAGGQEALKAEVERVRIELLRRQEERASAIQDMRVSSAELARLIRLDPVIPLWPVEDFRYPLPLPGDEFVDAPFSSLLDMASANRPELAENRALVQAAYQRVKAARSRPFLPNVVLNYNWGDFGGSPDLMSTSVNGKTVAFFGSSGSIRHFGTRDDFDVSLVWRLQNMGAGDYAAVREQSALRRQAELRQIQVQDRIIAEIVQAHESILGWRERVKITGQSLFNDKGEPQGPVFQAIRLNFDRLRNVPGTRPLEVLDSVRSLSDLLETYAQAITEYERARFRLLVALGIPAQVILRPSPPALTGQGSPAPPP